jgi:selenocysteine-specific elongation factor
MPREELRNRLGLAPRVFDALLSLWQQRGDLKEVGALVALPEHEPRLDPGQQAQAEAYLAALRANPFAPSPGFTPEEGLLSYLEGKGLIVRVQDGVAFEARAYQEMVGRITDYLRQHGSITLAQARDMFGTSRKYAQALLEHLDEKRMTRRVGDQRVLRGGPGV